MRWRTILACAAVVALAAAPECRAGAVNLEATMIHASNEAAAMDRRLDRVEFQLRRIFGFKYYRHYGEGRALLNLPGETTMDLGKGFRLIVKATHRDGRIRADVDWLRGGESLLRTTVSMKPGNHVILGGVPQEGGTLIVTLVAR